MLNNQLNKKVVISVGVLGTILKGPDKRLGKPEIRGRFKTIQIKIIWNISETVEEDTKFVNFFDMLKVLLVSEYKNISSVISRKNLFPTGHRPSG